MIVKINGNNLVDTNAQNSLIMGHISAFNFPEGKTFMDDTLMPLSGDFGQISGNEDGGMIEDFKNMMEFFDDVKENGLFHAIYGKSFFDVCKDFLKEFFHDLGVFILGNGDLFFLMPAITLMFITFLIGRNKYSKWIVPLWFGYFVTTVFHKLLL